MKKYLLLIMTLLSFSVCAEETPEKFKNPILNKKIINYREEFGIKMSPKGIDYELSAMPYKNCEFLLEDKKAVLFKCHPLYLSYNQETIYELFTTKYKYKDTCRVWRCMYGSGGYLKASAYYSQASDCEEEKQFDSQTELPEINCYDEIAQRGWQKYLPENYLKPTYKNAEKFKNPLFNKVLYSQKRYYKDDIKITPSYIQNLSLLGSDEKCERLEENKNAIMLKCHQAPFQKPSYICYKLYIARPGSVGMVGICDFVVDKEKKDLKIIKDIKVSLEELNLDHNWRDNYDLDCLQELLQRGWDKHIPVQIPQN